MLSENAIGVYKRLYFTESETSPSEVHKRIARFATLEITNEKEKAYWEDIFFNLMEENYIRPNSPMMMNACVQYPAQTSACFIANLEDNLESIMSTNYEAAMIFSSGSGIGINIGQLREKGAKLSTGGSSSGPISFLDVFSATAKTVKSGGRSRRAAILAMMFDDHPDLLDFINMKIGNDKYNSMNISIAASNNFMQAVLDNKKWQLIGVKDKEIKKELEAREIFQLICKSAHQCGDPGLWFIDRANEDNVVKKYGRIVTTNPCGEIGGIPYTSCALLSINIGKCVKDGKFDFTLLSDIAYKSTRLMDNAISQSSYPTKHYEEVANSIRPIGIGIMGFADALALMNIPYGSDQSLQFAEAVAKQLTTSVIESSIELAKEKGPFKYYEDNKYEIEKFLYKFGDDIVQKAKKYGIRNSQWTTIAPTGSISISCDCSAGMEPYFAIVWDKRLSDTNDKWNFINPIFKKRFEGEPWYDKVIELIKNNKGSCQGIKEIPDEVKKVFVTAHDIPWEGRIKIQAALQKWITNSISSTINLPHNTTVDEIEKIYIEAWKNRLKGVTIYIDGSRQNQPVAFGKADNKVEDRPIVLNGNTHKVKTGHGSLYVTINKDHNGNIFEVFSAGGKSGTVSSANLDALTRVISIALQECKDYKSTVNRIINTMIGIHDGTSVWSKLIDNDVRSHQILSIPDAIGKLMMCYHQKVSAYANKTCEKCGGMIAIQEGCETCLCCGESKCS